MRAAGRTITIEDLTAESASSSAPAGAARTPVYVRTETDHISPIVSVEVTSLGLVLQLGPAQSLMGSLPLLRSDEVA